MDYNYQVHKYEQSLGNGAKICVLLAAPEIKYPNDIMRYAVSLIVGRNMYNEMIDISLQRPYLRLIFIGETNLLRWENAILKGKEFEYVEIKLNNGLTCVGKVVLMRGGFYEKEPNAYMTNIVQEYLKNLSNTEDGIKYETYNELIEEPLDNPWFRVILLNINKLIFEPFI